MSEHVDFSSLGVGGENDDSCTPNISTARFLSKKGYYHTPSLRIPPAMHSGLFDGTVVIQTVLCNGFITV